LLAEQPADAESGQIVLSMPRSPPTPDDQWLNPMDRHYLEYFLDGRPSYFSNYLKIGGSYSFVTLPPRGYGFIRSSKPLRYAVLALSSVCKDEHRSQQTTQYIAQYRTHTAKAISNPSVVDVLYATCFIAELALYCQETEDTVFGLLRGMCEGFKRLKPNQSGVLAKDSLWMEYSYNRILRQLLLRLLERGNQSSAKSVILIEKACGLMDSSPFLSMDLKSQYGADLDLLILRRINTLGIYLEYFFLRHLVRINSVTTSDDAARLSEASLGHVVDQILEMMPFPLLDINGYINEILGLSHLNFAVDGQPKGFISKTFWRDRYWLSWYFTSILINNTLLSPILDRSEASAIIAAKSLCWLSVLYPVEFGYLVEFRNLLLAGLILTKSRHSDGKLIYNES
jgi:hypothetical protein